MRVSNNPRLLKILGFTLTYWAADHIGRYLVSNGDDLPGNLKFGGLAHLRLRRKPVPHTSEDYPELAESTMDGTTPESSAGGEQPKFTAFCKERSAHVIVKFSPKDEGPVAVRWRDILVTEFQISKGQTDFKGTDKM